MDLRSHTADYRAGFLAGIIAGIVDEAVLTGLALVQGASPWAGMKATAAIALGADVLQAPDGFRLSLFLVAMAVHFTLAVLFGLIGAALMRASSLGTSLAIGILFGLAIYAVDFYLFAPLYAPWMVALRAMPAVIATHALFGLVLALAYVLLRRPVERRSGLERRIHGGQLEAGRRRLVDRRAVPAYVLAR
ncbi:MAG: hypothetical protein ACM30H_03680 [Clostridia bacterium]